MASQFDAAGVEGYRQLAAREDVDSSLKATLRTVNRMLESHEKLSTLFVVNDPWTVENELLTPTMKIKRSRIEAAFDSSVDAWYSAGQKVVWHDDQGEPSVAEVRAHAALAPN